MNANEALETVKQLVEAYSKDPLGAGFAAILQLKQLYQNDREIPHALQQCLTNNPLVVENLPLAENLEREVATPVPRPSPYSRAMANKATQENSALKNRQETQAPAAIFSTIMETKDLEAVALRDALEVRRVYNDNKTLLSPAVGRLDEDTKLAIQDWLNGSGRPNLLGATKLGPGSNQLGILQGDIAGKLDETLAGDNENNPQYASALGKIKAPLERLSEASQKLQTKLTQLQSLGSTVVNNTPKPQNALPIPTPSSPKPQKN